MRGFTCKHETSDINLANCSPYFTALQYINNRETQRSLKTTFSLEESQFFQKTNITRRQLTVRGYCNQEEVKECSMQQTWLLCLLVPKALV